MIKIVWLLRALFYSLFFKRIGILSYIGKPVFLQGTRNIYINDRVRIFPGIRMQTLERGSIFIDENVSIGQNCHITSGIDRLIIGRNTTILGNVFITNIDHDYSIIGQHILEQKILFKETIISENCFIGYGASIQAGTILGKQCIVGTNAVVKGIFPDYCVLVGVPAKIVKRFDLHTQQWKKTTSDGQFLT